MHVCLHGYMWGVGYMFLCACRGPELRSEIFLNQSLDLPLIILAPPQPELRTEPPGFVLAR